MSGGGIPVITPIMNAAMGVGDSAASIVDKAATVIVDPVVENVVAPVADVAGEKIITPVGDVSGDAVQYGMDSGIIPSALFMAATGIPTDFTVANGGVGSAAAGTAGASSSAGATNAAGQAAAQEAAKTSVIDAAFKQAMVGAETGALTAGMSGQDPLKGALKGAVSGGVFGATSAAIPGDLVTTGSAGFDEAANTAINRGAASGAAALATGGDVGNAVIGGGLIGAASPTIDTKIADPALRSAAKGAIQGGVSAGLSGNDVLTGAGVGAAGGYTGAKFAEWSGYENGTVEQAMMAGLGATVGQQAASEVIGQKPQFLPVTSPTAPAGTMGLIERQARPSQGLLNGYQSLAVKRTNANRR